MLTMRRTFTPLCSLLLLAGVFSVPPSVEASRHVEAKTDTLTLGITATGGTVWGRVTVRYTRAHQVHTAACSVTRCLLHVPQGVTVHLTQTQTDATTWPFSQWQIQSGTQTTTAATSSLTLRMKHAMSITAVYVLKQTKSGYGPPSSDPYP